VKRDRRRSAAWRRQVHRLSVARAPRGRSPGRPGARGPPEGRGPQESTRPCDRSTGACPSTTPSNSTTTATWAVRWNETIERWRRRHPRPSRHLTNDDDLPEPEAPSSAWPRQTVVDPGRRTGARSPMQRARRRGALEGRVRPEGRPALRAPCREARAGRRGNSARRRSRSGRWAPTMRHTPAIAGSPPRPAPVSPASRSTWDDYGCLFIPVVGPRTERLAGRLSPWGRARGRADSPGRSMPVGPY
jgi:hypothetical protein